MKASLVIAAREYRQLVRMSTFWIALLLVPVAILASGILASLPPRRATGAFLLLDRSGRFTVPINAALALQPPPPAFAAATMPASLEPHASRQAFAAAIDTALGKRVATALGRQPLIAAIYIPKDLGANHARLHIWMLDGRARPLVDIVERAVSRRVRQEAIGQAGLSPAVAARLAGLDAPVEIVAASRRLADSLPLLAPIGLDYLLVLLIGLSGSWMLQAMIEERANKLLEAVLACVSAHQLLIGKLIGSGAAGLTIAGVWIGFALLAVLALPGAVAGVPAAALAAIGSPFVVLGLVFYFLCGYLVTAMLFLGLGATTDSMQNVQGYLLPLVAVLIVPLMVLFNSMLADPHGALPAIMTWIPLYTPFAMLARLALGPSPAELLGTSVLLIAFIALELTALGRVFHASLLRAGQPPRPVALLRLMLARERD